MKIPRYEEDSMIQLLSFNNYIAKQNRNKKKKKMRKKHKNTKLCYSESGQEAKQKNNFERRFLILNAKLN